ncbi:MAG TPA: cation diffusion facilitator family transporter [Candidatus Binatia bacterium]|nr:cation diffusion facilitator family transporter [Candidatus Binatia bacterium]
MAEPRARGGATARLRHAHGQSAAAAGRRRLLAVFGMVAAFLVVEVIGGLLTNSLALLADAGHMFTDAAGIGLALLAIWFAGRPATAEKSFGYYRFEIFAALANAFILFAVAGYIVYEAIQRFAAAPDVVGLPVVGIAVVGLTVNLVSMRLLQPGSQTSLNLRGAYLEVLGDLLGSVAVLVAGLVIILTGWTPIDPIASLLIAALILPRTWSLLREAVDVLLQATPKGIDLDEVRQHLLRAVDVVDVHDLHAWTLTSGINVVSAHVVMRPGADPAQVLEEVCACLTDDFDMEHSTIQLETADRRRLEHAMHP